MMYYLDASAWVKRYVQENGSDVIGSLFDSPLACSTLGFIEIISTLARKHKAGYLGLEQMQERIATLEEDWNYFVEIDLNLQVVEQAKIVAQKFALRGADAIHLASALVLQMDLQDDDQLFFVTSDQELVTAARASRLETFDPTQTEQTKK